MRASYLPAAAVVAVVFLLGFASIPVIAYPLGVVLVVAYLLLSAADRRATRARRTHS